MEKIYTRFGKQPTLRGFIKKLFNCKSYACSTSVETFYDIECMKLQCTEGKYRSIDDLYIIFNTYYPGIEMKTLINALVTTSMKDLNGNDLNFYIVSCGDIDKTTCLYHESDMFKDASDLKRYSSHSPKELLGLLGMNPDELRNHIKKHKK